MVQCSRVTAVTHVSVSPLSHTCQHLTCLTAFWDTILCCCCVTWQCSSSDAPWSGKAALFFHNSCFETSSTLTCFNLKIHEFNCFWKTVMVQTLLSPRHGTSLSDLSCDHCPLSLFHTPSNYQSSCRGSLFNLAGFTCSRSERCWRERGVTETDEGWCRSWNSRRWKMVGEEKTAVLLWGEAGKMEELHVNKAQIVPSTSSGACCLILR